MGAERVQGNVDGRNLDGIGKNSRGRVYEEDTIADIVCFIVLLFFLQIEGKTLHQQKDYNFLYFNIHSIVVVWKQTDSIS